MEGFVEAPSGHLGFIAPSSAYLEHFNFKGHLTYHLTIASFDNGL